MAIDTERCEMCGGTGTPIMHTDGCPVLKVRIVDKRGAQNAGVTPEDVAATAMDEADDVAPVDEGDLTERQKRIIALKVKGREAPLEEAEKAELLRLQAAEEDNEGGEDDVVEAVTAFLVVIDHNGVAQATSNVNLMMRLQREATVDDMDAGCHIVTRDILASQTAKQVIFGMQVSAQAMQRQAAEQATLQRLQGGAPGRRR